LKSTTIENKTNHIYRLLEKLAKGEELYPQSEKLQVEIFGKTGEAQERSLRRYLKDIHELYGHIVLTEKKPKEFSDRKVTIYRVADRKKDVSEILRFFLENSKDLGWLLQSVHENDPTILDDANEKEALQEQLRQDADIFLFKSSPFENFEDEEHKKLFNIAKEAVKNREYRNIDYRYPRKEEVLNDCKLLKMVFMNNNWYLAVEDTSEELRFLRFNYIGKISYSKKSGYQKKLLEKYTTFFKELQNPMTLKRPFETARILASERVAHYFQENMKPFFPSQKFIRQNSDGSVEFSVSFTQPLEILPFIKKWQPDLSILSPESLKEIFVDDMKKSLENHT
jgi:predicted DNA-binding transcriptional regulator YafY